MFVDLNDASGVKRSELWKRRYDFLSFEENEWRNRLRKNYCDLYVFQRGIGVLDLGISDEIINLGSRNLENLGFLEEKPKNNRFLESR